MPSIDHAPRILSQGNVNLPKGVAHLTTGVRTLAGPCATCNLTVPRDQGVILCYCKVITFINVCVRYTFILKMHHIFLHGT